MCRVSFLLLFFWNIVLFAFSYLMVGIDIDGEIVKYNLTSIDSWTLREFIRDFNESFHLSVGMFSGIGVDRTKPTPMAYMVANMEMLIGVIMVGIATGTLTRKIIR